MSTKSVWSWLWAGLAGSAALVSFASLTGVLRVLGTAAPGLFVGTTITTLSLLYFRGSALKNTLQGLGIRRLTAFHIWRIAAALLFYYYGAQNLLPQLFVQRAAVGDLITGVLAALAALWPSRAAYWTVHFFGLGDLVLAMATGVSLAVAKDPQMANITGLPVALIPFLGVGVTVFMHVVAFDVLRRGREPKLAATY